MRITRIFTFAAVFASLVLPAAALAQPAVSGYERTGPQIQEEIDQGGAGGGGGSDSGTPVGGTEGTSAATPVAAVQSGDDDGADLPFTGFDVALLLAAGLLLVGLGFGMRRLTRPTEVA
jgi:hypothetical protein